MTHYFYLFGLVIGIAGLLTLDFRTKLAFWYDARRSLRVIGLAMSVFIVWDVAGIGRGIFFHGASAYSLPFTLLPEFPIEELVFLFLLNYTALLLYLGASRVWQRT